MTLVQRYLKLVHGPRPVVFGWACRFSENFNGIGPDFKEMGVLACLRFTVISYIVLPSHLGDSSVLDSSLVSGTHHFLQNNNKEYYQYADPIFVGSHQKLGVILQGCLKHERPSNFKLMHKLMEWRCSTFHSHSRVSNNEQFRTHFRV